MAQRRTRLTEQRSQANQLSHCRSSIRPTRIRRLAALRRDDCTKQNDSGVVTSSYLEQITLSSSNMAHLGQHPKESPSIVLLQDSSTVDYESPDEMDASRYQVLWSNTMDKGNYLKATG